MGHWCHSQQKARLREKELELKWLTSLESLTVAAHILTVSRAPRSRQIPSASRSGQAIRSEGSQTSNSFPKGNWFRIWRFVTWHQRLLQGPEHDWMSVIWSGAKSPAYQLFYWKLFPLLSKLRWQEIIETEPDFKRCSDTIQNLALLLEARALVPTPVRRTWG